jgi:hypothetical protein
MASDTKPPTASKDTKDSSNGGALNFKRDKPKGAGALNFKRDKDKDNDKPKPTAAAAAPPISKARRKANFVSWFADCLKNDVAGARGQFLKARDYVAVANVIRARARDQSVAHAHAEALKLLDSKGHFMNIVDQVAASTEDTRKSWEETKSRSRLKFAKAGGADGIAEKKRQAREAKAEFKQMQVAREDREQRAKDLKTSRKEYKAVMNVLRMKGACLDWCNLGKCSFGTQCEFKHEETDKASLVELARSIKANGLGGRTGAKDAETVAKVLAKKEHKKQSAAGDDDEDGHVKFGTHALGALSDDSDSDTKPAKKQKKLSVLPGEDDDDSDDEGVPRIVRERLKRRKEQERLVLDNRERRREEKTKDRERLKKDGGSGGRSGGRGGGRGGRGGGGSGDGGRGGRGGGGGGDRRFEKRPERSFDLRGPKTKKPRHADGRHSVNAAATAAGTGRPRTKFD